MTKMPAKTPFLLLTLGLLTAVAMPVNATPTVTVTLKVHATLTFPFNEPAFTTDGLTTCTFNVTAGAHGGAVLDQAKANGCIDDWSYVNLGGKFLTGIKGRSQTAFTNGRNTFTAWPCQSNPLDPLNSGIVASSWVLLFNGVTGTVGSTVASFVAGTPAPTLDSYAAASGDVIEAVYVVDTCAFANALAVGTTGIHADSPVLLQGNALTEPGNL